MRLSHIHGNPDIGLNKINMSVTVNHSLLFLLFFFLSFLLIVHNDRHANCKYLT